MRIRSYWDFGTFMGGLAMLARSLGHEVTEFGRQCIRR